MRLTLLTLDRRTHGTYWGPCYLLKAMDAAREILRGGEPRVAMVDDEGAIVHVWTLYGHYPTIVTTRKVERFRLTP
jgi:hypothetical protein